MFFLQSDDQILWPGSPFCLTPVGGPQCTGRSGHVLQQRILPATADETNLESSWLIFKVPDLFGIKISLKITVSTVISLKNILKNILIRGIRFEI